MRKAAGLKRYSEVSAEHMEKLRQQSPASFRWSPYLVAYGCFGCRKSFKRRPSDPAETLSCPQCGGPSYNMGRGFKAPRKGEAEQWKKVQKLYEAGYRFHVNTRRDIPPYPGRLRDVDDFIRDNPNHPFRIWEKLAGPR